VPSSELERSLRASVLAFRLGMSARANQELVRVVDALAAVVAGNAALSLELTPILAELVAAQERGDGLRVADVLEYDVVPRQLGNPT
jgi:hypothetical protein